MDVWMVVSTGFYEDNRVRKAAVSADASPGVNRVHVLAMNRESIASAPITSELGAIDVRQFGPPSDPWSSSFASKAALRFAFVLWSTWTVLVYARRGDIVHCHDVDVSPVGLIAKMFGRRFVLDAHEIYSGRHGLSRFGIALSGLLERWAVRGAGLVVAVSESAADYFSGFVGSGRIVVATNSRRSHEIVSDRAHKLVSNGSDIRLVYIGGFQEGRGLHQAIDAMMDLPPDYSLDLIGFGSLAGELVERARLADDRVRVLDPITVDEVVKTASRYDVGLVLTEPNCRNHELTVSNKIFDYAAAGLACILSPVHEHVRIRSEYDIGPVVPEVTAQAIVQAIAELVADPGWQASASHAARRLAHDRSWEREWEGVSEWYGGHQG